MADRYVQNSAWKPVIASATAASRIDRKEFERFRGLAREVSAMLDGNPEARVSSRLNDARLKGYIRHFAAAEFPEGDGARATLQDWALKQDDR